MFRTLAARGLLRIGCMLWSGLAAHPDQDYAVPPRLSLRRGNRLHFQGFYELVRAWNPASSKRFKPNSARAKE